MLFIVARGIDQGRGAALASATGVTIGSLVHLTAAVLGLSVLLAPSAFAFSVVKYLGVAKLMQPGISTGCRGGAAPSRPLSGGWLGRSFSTSASPPRSRTRWRMSDSHVIIAGNGQSGRTSGGVVLGRRSGSARCVTVFRQRYVAERGRQIFGPPDDVEAPVGFEQQCLDLGRRGHPLPA